MVMTEEVGLGGGGGVSGREMKCKETSKSER